MRTKKQSCWTITVIGVAALLAAAPAHLSAQQTADPAIRIGDSDLGGVVTSPSGLEAGVWVIAETTELPTKFAKIVVTDDQVSLAGDRGLADSQPREKLRSSLCAICGRASDAIDLQPGNR